MSSLGFSTTITLVLTAPPSLVAGVVGIAIGISSGKFNDRTWHISAMMGIATVGFVISAVTLNVAARYLSCFLFASGKWNRPFSLVNQADDNSRCLLRQFRDPGLGLRHARPNSREESSLALHGQHDFHGEFHLHAVLVPEERRTQVRDCHEQQCFLCICHGGCGLGHANLAAGAEPKA